MRSDSHVCVANGSKKMAEAGTEKIPDTESQEANVSEIKTETSASQPTKDVETVVGNGNSKEVEDNGDIDKKENVKKEIVVDENLKAKIVKQIEYYFGDMNLSKDRFLKEQVQLDDGWVPSERMMKFNRLNSICSDWDVIAQALRESSELMEVYEDGTKIRRSPSKPLPGDSKERRDAVTARTIYANRFPLDAKLDDLMLFFESFGPVEHIFMKRDFHKHTFKGSVFTTFKNKEDAEKFLNDVATTFIDTKLEVKQWKTDYFKSKPEKKKEAAKKRSADKMGGAEEDPDQKDVKESKEKKDDNDKKGKAEEIDADDEEKVKQQMTRGAVLHISGMNQETDREEVRRLFLKHGDVSWVDFDKGVTEGYIRLKEPNSAARTLESLQKMEGGVVLHGACVHIRVVEGDEELQYWQKMYRDIAERKILKKEGLLKHRAGQNRKNRGGGRMGKRGRRNDRYDRDHDAPPPKVARADDD
ncbi:hypothetical protein RRG08_059738 [Elysia crispata]|uniref:Lupus La protein n=1 Tax=Elysia crispata TaxID=231223 RepID=A0AAE0YP54_9GAST|nr:hypothetical protein RRG08_059738 [Elysia crispata]